MRQENLIGVWLTYCALGSLLEIYFSGYTKQKVWANQSCPRRKESMVVQSDHVTHIDAVSELKAAVQIPVSMST